MDEHYKTYLKVYLPIFLVLFIVSLSYSFYLQIVSFQSKENVSSTIQSIINQQASKGLLLPELVFINLNSSYIDSLYEEGVGIDDIKAELLKNVKSNLADNYLKNDLSSDLQQSYYLSPLRPTEEGNFILTDQQLQSIEKNVAFLVNQIDREVSEVRNEISDNLERLNIWMAIWLAIFGLSGVFIPVVLNRDLISKASDAKKNADKALDDIREIQSISNEALNTAYSSHLFIGVHQFIRIASNFSLANVDDQMKRLAKGLNLIKEKLLKCSDNPSDSFVLESLIDLTFKLEELSRSSYVDIVLTEKINVVSEKISERLNDDIKKEDINFIANQIDEFVALINSKSE